MKAKGVLPRALIAARRAEISAADPGAGDWFVLIDATDVSAVAGAIAARLGDTRFKSVEISTGIYRLLWDIAKADLA